MWINRDFNPTSALKSRLPIGVLIGPRQVGKTRLLERSLGSKAHCFYLDDLAVREQLRKDPRLYLNDDNVPILIDEVQYAPEIFSELKRKVDVSRRENKSLAPIWLTGSNRTLLDKNVKESLAGRASYFDMHPLSVHELKDTFNLETFFLKGGWPELNANQDADAVGYLNDLIKTFIEKDIVLASGIQKIDAFTKALRLLAGRTAQLLNASEVGAQAGVKGESISEWLTILSRNSVLNLLEPFHTNLNKRLIKSPKIFFMDTGLASRLQGWQSAAPIMNSPMAGALFETLVYSELIKTRDHLGCAIKIYFYRTKEGEEIDFLVEKETKNGIVGVALEVKLSRQTLPKIEWPRSLELEWPVLTKHWCVSLNDNSGKSVNETEYIHLKDLAERLISL